MATTLMILGACAGPSAQIQTDHAVEAHTRGGTVGVFGAHASVPRVSPDDMLGIRVVAEFGAVFVAQGGVVTPREWIFPDESSVVSFQKILPIRASATMRNVELQDAALQALESARHEAAGRGLTISPNGAGSSRRDFATTLKLWRSRLEPGLAHWVEKGKVTAAEKDRILALPSRQQVLSALDLEARGVWLSTYFDKSILQSVAAPGTSQHLSLLAIDIAEHGNADVRMILARHGWYQTVYSDLPHFTYLGVPEDRLPSLGLVRRTNVGRVFWVVDVPRVRGEKEPDVMEQCPF